MWIRIGVVLLIACIIAGGVVATRPDNYSIQRSAVVNAPPEVVFEQVNDFHRWERWSPFEKLDPEMRKTFEGSPSGVDARYHWKGNSRAGEGRMRIAESVPAKRIAIDMHFIEPFESRARTTFTFEPVEAGTRVTWGMSGANTTAGKVMSLFGGMEGMLGRAFDEGLAKLGSAAEADLTRRAQAPADTAAAAPAR